MNSDESTKLAVLPTDYPRTSNQVVEAEETYQIEGAHATDILRALIVLVHRYTGDTHIVLGTSSSILRIDVTPETSFDSIHFPQTKSLSVGDLTVFVNGNSLRTVYNTVLFTPLRIQLLHLHLTQILKDRSIPIGRISLRTEKEQGILPDPRAPLNWCEWPGPITSIFASNATKTPEKAVIITQTKSHTYGSLLRATNTLSNHLLKHGVERGDVVMIYAHRSADLVLAVLGTLTAGATFSVIDPAYPPERQIVYLSVARPKAVIILQGAQDDNPVDPSVRGYWEKDLGGVKVCVEGVSLGEDGSVYADGGTLEENTNNPGVVLGPDSVATLSFTSGSTGVPKGVRGRHYSLTHFFPWMATRFGLGPESRFTMLSGIAHDPIQRDIFTPLFLGASLHVPPSSAIGTPGALASWMDAQKVTVTHLTPAMGQLVTTTGANEGENTAGAAPSVPSLRAAFFVGDLLTKRDVARLQALARNVVVINMYGTTETQRAVSYHALVPFSEDPAYLSTQKEVIPAGKGMKDVQLLVVNRNDKSIPCAVGEAGEIYVRSGGLAEGYLVPPEALANGEPDMNEEKFVRNWFRSANSSGQEDAGYVDTLSTSSDPARHYWHGIRDRMYRSGDLGRYDTEGGVECIGRADNQIKIRGFRIELGEVDTHLAAHPGVRENVTLVRRDKDEEKMLVSYIVPVNSWEGDASEDKILDVEEGGVEGGIRRYAKLIRDIRTHLKKKLPGYSIPTLIIPLSRMPLNPNGKIDRPALPFPDTAAAVASLAAVSASALAAASNSATTTTHSEITPTQKTILKIFASLLPGFSSSQDSLPPIPLEESFFDLGGHSILATRLVFEMRRAFPVLKERIGLGVVYTKYAGELASVRGLASIIGTLLEEDLGLPVVESDAKQANGIVDVDDNEAEDNYTRDLDTLISTLAPSYPSYAPSTTSGLHVFLTGATGFLGAFILQQLLSLPHQSSSSVAHVTCLVRASSATSAQDRLRESCASRGVWSESWISSNHLTVVPGDLGLPHYGVTPSEWEALQNNVDVVIHNGALVHWVYPYERLKGPNVVGTLTAVELAGTKEKPKSLVFVSSTSVLDTPAFVRIGENVISQNQGDGVLETDTLEASRRGLKTGYGQSKWVAEKLLFEAGRRGLGGYIIRPGYVVGESNDGVTNTDDFVWRMVKGCVQLGSVPDMSNGVNMLPVDRVAMCCVRAATVGPMTGESRESGPGGNMNVMNVTAQPLPTFNDLFNALKTYGWAVEKTEYVQWRLQLEAHVMDKSRKETGEVEEDNALYPLLHFVLDDLPTSTKAPMLDDRNTVAVVERGRTGQKDPPVTVDEELMGRYFAWLVRAQFLPPPQYSQGGKRLPELADGVTKAAGRSGI